MLYRSRQDSILSSDPLDGSVELILGKLVQRTETNAKAIEKLGTTFKLII